MRRAVRAAVVVALVGITTAACGHASSSYQDSEPGRKFAAVVAEFVTPESMAKQSDRENAVLREAAKTGVISFEDYQAVINDTVACTRAAGAVVNGPDVQAYAGIKRIMYSEAGTDSTALDACAKKYSFAVEMLWDGSPGNIDERDAAFAKLRPALLQCLTDYGVTVPTDATYDDIITKYDTISEDKRLGPACSVKLGWWGS